MASQLALDQSFGVRIPVPQLAITYIATSYVTLNEVVRLPKKALAGGMSLSTRFSCYLSPNVLDYDS